MPLFWPLLNILGGRSLHPVSPHQQAKTPWRLVLHQTQLSMVPSLGSEGPGCGTSISFPTHFFNPSSSRPVLCKVSAGDKGLTCTPSLIDAAASSPGTLPLTQLLRT